MPKEKTIKAWAVVYNGILDLDGMNWFDALAYTIFPSRKEAKRWLGETLKRDPRIVPCTIILNPRTKNGKRKHRT